MIYFDKDKKAYGYEINNYVCTVDDETWAKYADTDKWDIVNGKFTDITNTEEYINKTATVREAQFNKDFFNTCLGYIRRSVNMADGSKKDFLSDLLPVIAMGINSGNKINVIAYKKPDFKTEVENWEEYQEEKQVTAQFINECFTQLSNDFFQ